MGVEGERAEGIGEEKRRGFEAADLALYFCRIGGCCNIAKMDRDQKKVDRFNVMGGMLRKGSSPSGSSTATLREAWIGRFRLPRTASIEP